jgi:hypothetical protein
MSLKLFYGFLLLFYCSAVFGYFSKNPDHCISIDFNYSINQLDRNLEYVYKKLSYTQEGVSTQKIVGCTLSIPFSDYTTIRIGASKVNQYYFLQRNSYYSGLIQDCSGNNTEVNLIFYFH